MSRRWAGMAALRRITHSQAEFRQVTWIRRDPPCDQSYLGPQYVA